MRTRFRAALAVSLMALPLLVGCATAPAPAPGTVSSPMPGRGPEPAPSSSGASAGTPAPTSPMPGTQMGTTASGGTITQTAPAPRDSSPSAEAQAVLSTIPEPIAPGEVLHGGGTSSADSAEAPAMVDTAAAARDSGDVPIPSLTQPLGDRPGARSPLDTLSRSGSAATPAAPASPPPNPPAASPDSCWRVQVAAVPQAARAAALRDAAQSQLWLSMVIETEKGLHKVRTQSCLTADGAERLKQRAIAAGFQGAFRFRRPK